MTKAERVKAYRELYPTYGITGVKKMTKEQVDAWKTYSEGSLEELYKCPSDAKINSNRELLERYEPQQVLGYVGNCMTYSVMLIAKNGSLLHVTRDNNYLVEIV